MASIVESLQSDALKPEISVSNLLRSVKLIAAKLKLGQIEDWVEKELSGYGDEPIPSYRTVKGLPRAHNPYRGWIPIVMEDPKMMEAISSREIGQKISELEDLLTDKSETTLQIPFSADIIAQLNRGANVQLPKMSLLVGRSTVVGIVDAVRNKILDWAIELEKSGIMGSEASFSSDEQARAQQPNVTMHIGSIGNFVGNLGVGNSSGDIAVGAIDSKQVSDLVAQIKKHENDLVEVGASSQALKDVLARLDEALNEQQPRQGVLRSLLQDLRAIVASSAGNLVSSGVLHIINQILGTGVP
ncbi:hypothetical protein ACVIIV_005499 [Bradyrhizobium sp. USDA 4354]